MLKHRLGETSIIIQLAFGLFAITFIVTRLIMNSYISYVHLSVCYDLAPSDVPVWAQHVISLAVVLGCLLQFFWGQLIIKKLIKLAVSGTEKDDSIGKKQQ